MTTQAQPEISPPGSSAKMPSERAASTTARRPRRFSPRVWGIRLASFVVVILLWYVVTATGLVKPLYLPTPGSVWDAFIRANSDHPVAAGVDRVVRGEQNYYLWEHLLASLQRIAIGVVAAVVVGIPVGLLMSTVSWVGTALEPYLSFLRSLPPLAYIGLLIVWFGIGDTSKVWLLFLAAFPPIAMATISGVRGVKEDQINAVRSLGASRFQAVRTVTIPATLPELMNGIRVATGFTWTCVVAAELNAGIPGIGGLAYLSGTQLKTPLVMACIIIIGVAAVVLDALLKAVEGLLVPWRGKA